MGLLVRSTAFSFSDPLLVKRNASPELELAVGSFPYSSLAPPTTDERAAVKKLLRKTSCMRSHVGIEFGAKPVYHLNASPVRDDPNNRRQ